jgi:hypothetical protein
MSEETWLSARLIPISGLGGSEEKERRAASALLAVLGAVKEFGRATFGRLGGPAGAVSTFCEVPFDLEDGRSVRVDGLVRVRRGKKTWTLLVEVKTGSSELGQDQVEAYLEAVRENHFDGLLTISNQIVPAASQHPVRVDGRRFGRVPLFHLSWTRILTIAHMVKEHQGVSDPDQAWILGELIRYLEYEGSGALAFEDMGPNWVKVRSAVKEQTLRLSDDGIDDIATRWDQLIQYLCLGLGGRLGQEVRPLLSRKEAADPDGRVASVSRDLASTGALSAGINIPNTVGPISLRANLRAMTASVSTEVMAPELGRPSTRLNWLLRQLRNAPPELRIDVAFFRTRSTSSELLTTAVENPKRLLMESDRIPRSFMLTLSGVVGTKRRSGHGSFITDMSALLDRFYREVVQDLRPWTPPAPQLEPAARETAEGEAATPDESEEASDE